MEGSLPLACALDFDKLLIAYANNKALLFDLHSRSLHQWTKDNISAFPKSYLSRYNRIVGAV